MMNMMIASLKKHKNYLPPVRPSVAAAGGVLVVMTMPTACCGTAAAYVRNFG